MAFLGNETLWLLSSFVVILRSSGSLLCFLFHKSFQESKPELTKPHTHLTRFIFSGLKCTTDFAYRPSKHTETLTALRPRASGLINWLKKDQRAVAFDRSITFSQMMDCAEFEQNAGFRVWHSLEMKHFGSFHLLW